MSIVITALVVLLAAAGAAALAVAVLHVTSRWQSRRQQAAGDGVRTAIQGLTLDHSRINFTFIKYTPRLFKWTESISDRSCIDTA